MDDHMRHETDGMSMARKELEALRRRYRKKRTIADSANEILPTLKAQLADHEHLLRTHIDENKRCSIQIEGMKQEVDLAIARLLRQEVIEKSKRQGLESLLKEVAGMEDEIGNWSAEERRQNKLIAVLSAQREMKAREATRAQVAEKDTHEQVKVKELVILDLSKKCNEVNNRLKEFSALYDVVKNERNKYVSLIQSSSQALAEMKEKIKILMNEVCCNFTRFYPRALLPA
jgi:chromosome segregation ATPase